MILAVVSSHRKDFSTAAQIERFGSDERNSRRDIGVGDVQGAKCVEAEAVVTGRRP